MYTGMVVLRGGRVRDGELHADECMQMNSVQNGSHIFGRFVTP